VGLGVSTPVLSFLFWILIFTLADLKLLSRHPHLKKDKYAKRTQRGLGMSFSQLTFRYLFIYTINVGLLRFDDFDLLKMLPADSESEESELESEEEPLSLGIKRPAKSLPGSRKLLRSCFVIV